MSAQKQVGTVIVFKEGVTKEQALKALIPLRDLLACGPQVRMFDPELGWPVFYIP